MSVTATNNCWWFNSLDGSVSAIVIGSDGNIYVGSKEKYNESSDGETIDANYIVRNGTKYELDDFISLMSRVMTAANERKVMNNLQKGYDNE